jgi:outer membrane protein assembly factor BamA
VTERPLIEKISLIGFKRIGMTDQRIRETLKSKEGQYLDALAVQDDIQELTSIYEKKGFSQVQIDQQVSVDQKTNKATVVLKAIEGKKKRIKRIFVEGNVNVTDRKILGLIKTKRALVVQ